MSSFWGSPITIYRQHCTHRNTNHQSSLGICQRWKRYLVSLCHCHGRFGHVAIAVIAILFMLIPVVGSTGIPGSTLFPVPAKPYNVFPFLFLMYLVVGGGWFLMLRLHSPEIIEDMERDIEAVHTKFSEMKKV